MINIHIYYDIIFFNIVNTKGLLYLTFYGIVFMSFEFSQMWIEIFMITIDCLGKREVP